MVRYRVRVGGKEYEVEIKEEYGDTYIVEVDGEELEVIVEAPSAGPAVPRIVTAGAPREAPKAGRGRGILSRLRGPRGKVVKASVPGKVVKIMVKEGDEVKEGDTVAILESMKMRMEIKSEYSGKVKEVLVSEGEFVEQDQPIIVID